MSLKQKILAQLKVHPALLAVAIIALGAVLLGPASADDDDGGAVQYIVYDDLSNSDYGTPETNGSDDDGDQGRCDQGVGNGSEGCNPGNSGNVVDNDEGENAGPGNPGAKGGNAGPGNL